MTTLDMRHGGARSSVLAPYWFTCVFLLALRCGSVEFTRTSL